MVQLHIYLYNCITDEKKGMTNCRTAHLAVQLCNHLYNCATNYTPVQLSIQLYNLLYNCTPNFTTVQLIIQGYNPLLLLFTLSTGPGRSLSLKLSDTRVYEHQIRARLGTTAYCCKVVVLLLAGSERRALRVCLSLSRSKGS